MSEIVHALVPLLAYQQSRAHIFHSFESIRWFVRKHKSELLEAGALLEIAGRTQISPESFDAVVLTAGKRAAQKETA